MSSDRLIDARAALARSDVLIAYDLARMVLDDDPNDLEARYIVALSLARAGAAEKAGIEAAELGRRIAASDAPSRRLREDVDALVARLAKDVALAGPPETRASCARAAAELYEAVADRHNRYYSCVNAASLWLIAGDEARACHLAERTRELLRATPDDDDAYWRLVSEAEAALVLGETHQARAALRAAAAVRPVDLGARAATRRQLRLVCRVRGIAPEIVDVLEIPSVLHYCGHMVDNEPGSVAALSHVAAEVEQFLAQHHVGFAYGSLACGADIIIAELAIAHDIELHVVLPFGVEEFKEASVTPGGVEWQRRFGRCLVLATSVSFASDSAYGGDDELFTYGSRVAMGHALNRATFLDAPAEQLAVWDGLPARGPGTGSDVEAWRRSGRATHVISVADHAKRPLNVKIESESARHIRAILFTDLRGFSTLRDEHFPIYVRIVLGALAQVVERHRATLLGNKSWGDAIQAVFSDVHEAARCALELQEVIGEIDMTASGLPLELAMRVGAHVGPVLRLDEPFDGDPTFWGRELTRAARIEPRTPEGEVYVTDAFAALLALEPASDLCCEYVGRITTAKDFETIPMYRLRYA
jgi:adenylate cyclase